MTMEQKRRAVLEKASRGRIQLSIPLSEKDRDAIRLIVNAELTDALQIRLYYVALLKELHKKPDQVAMVQPFISDYRRKYMLIDNYATGLVNIAELTGVYKALSQ
jgi:hypothetical protein